MIRARFTAVAAAIFLVFYPIIMAFAANPITGYFSRLLDETKAEIAIGKMLIEQFQLEVRPHGAFSTNEELSELVKQFAPSSPRPLMPYKVFVLESSLPGEFPFPGGPFIVTSALLDKAANREQKEFIIARNIMHIALRHPMKLIKREGLYARALQVIKHPVHRRDPRSLRDVLRGYLKIIGGMDQEEADTKGVLLTPKPSTTRIGALKLLKELEQMVWPISPWTSGDLSARITTLESMDID